MTKLSREGMRELRARARADREQRAAGAGEILVGMGSCGMAAGALAARDALVDALRRHGRSEIAIRQTGCMGLCYSEPTVEVRVPGMPPTIYGGVTPEVAARIVEEHVVGGQLVSGHIYDRPAPDLVPRMSGGK